METATMERQRERLLEIRNRLREDIERRAEAVAEDVQAPGDISRLPTHPADRDTEGLASEMATGLVQQREMESVNAALERIDAGTYGNCMRCGREIGDERLQALPDAPYCIDCERRIEEESAVTGPDIP